MEINLIDDLIKNRLHPNKMDEGVMR